MPNVKAIANEFKSIQEHVNIRCKIIKGSSETLPRGEYRWTGYYLGMPNNTFETYYCKTRDENTQFIIHQQSEDLMNVIIVKGTEANVKKLITKDINNSGASAEFI